MYLDVISQYPDVAMTESFPVGNFEVLLGDGLKYLSLSSPLKVNNKEVYGLIFLLIEAPPPQFKVSISFVQDKRQSFCCNSL